MKNNIIFIFSALICFQNPLSSLTIVAIDNTTNFTITSQVASEQAHVI